MSALLEQFSTEIVLTFVLVLARLGGMIATSPLYSSSEIPVMARALLVITLSLLIAPLQWGRLALMPTSVVEFLIVIASEILLGLILGMGIMILIAGVQIAGQIVGQLSGMSLADVFNPTFDSEMPLMSNLISMVMVTLFLLIGGHRSVLGALLHTFDTLPLGGGANLEAGSQLLVSLLAESMILGIRVAAPAMAALVMTTILLGLVGRSLPQLNIMTLGFGLNSLITLGTMSLGLISVNAMLEDRLPDTLDRSVQALEAPATPKTQNTAN